MLGLGTGIVKGGAGAKTIVTDNLVLKHNYSRGQVHQVSTGAAFFDGTDDYIQLPSAFSHSSNKITISAWVYSGNNSDAATIFSNRTTSDNTRGILFYVSDAESLTVKCQNVSIQATVGLALNNWVHACFTYDPSLGSQNIKLYENGVLANTGAATVDFDDTAWSNAKIGRGINQNYWYTGYICNVGIWDEVLTQAQIKSIMWKDYAGLTSSETTDLVSWYNLDSAITSTSVLDNHYGGGSELGSELVTNGSFTTDSDWNKNSNWIIDTTGGATAVADGSSTLDINQVITSHPVANNVYKVTFDVTSVTAGSVHFTFGGATGADRDSVGTYTEYITASNTDRLRIDSHGSNLFTGSVDNVSVKLVNGNTGTLS